MPAKRDGLEAMQRDVDVLVKYISDFREFLPVPVVQVTCQGIIVDAGAAMLRLIGRSEDEIIGEPLVALTSPRAEMLRIHELTLEQGSVRDAECSVRATDGFDVPVIVSTMVRRDEGGQPIGYFASFVDIRERSRSEEVVRRSQERLLQAQKMEALGQLASGVAHDFNNFLGGINGYADLLARHPADPDKVTRCVRGIHELVKRAASLTQKLLVFSRKSEVEWRKVDLANVVGEVVTILEHTIDPRIEIRQELGDGPVIVRGDPGHLQTAVLNLGLNARDAMPEGGELTFSLSLVELGEDVCRASSFDIAPSTYVELRVTDTGSGMNEETKERLFEPFFTTKDPGIGTGLGLTTVYSVVKDHGGAIHVRSVQGEGTVFILYFPRLAATATSIPPPGVDEGECRSGRLLIIDDQEDIRFTASQILGEAGFEVVTAATGPEGLEAFRTRAAPFDLVLLDLVLPGMDGYEVLRRLREMDPGIKVLMTSGYLTAGQSYRLMEKGAQGFLPKPFRGGELYQAVLQVLEGA